MNKCVKITVNGIVQGVGFRPFIYRLAQEFNFNGSVKNTLNGVEIILVGNLEQAQLFINVMSTQLPELAKIEHINNRQFLTDKSYNQFSILASDKGTSSTKIPADTAICSNCLLEIFDNNSRYYLYPYTSCTHCGPRYSLIEGLPYDRDKTTFSDFALCQQCNQVYQDPLNRRYHAQTTVCQGCGPQLSHSFEQIKDAIDNKAIIALKSHNGFRLIANASVESMIKQLRQRKNRPQKPFALMALNIASIKQHAIVNEVEERALISNARPIVLLDKKTSCKLPENLAPGLNQLGFMLPSTGLDYLLFYYILEQPQACNWLKQANSIVLLVTSANVSGDSIIADNGIAKEQLNQIADLVVSDNRRIAMKNDDSVIQVIDATPMSIRRSRGFVPETLALNTQLPNVFATGALLKNSFCFIHQNEAYLSQYIGDMDSVDSIEYFEHIFTHSQKLFGVSFDALACDLHPDLYTTSFAERFNLPLYRIQHHEAHAAAVIAEHGIKGQALGVILDGFGLGEDKIARGGELYLCDIDKLAFSRIGELMPMAYIGGDRVQKQPWRMALALCMQFNLPISAYLQAQPQAKNLIALLRQNHQQASYTTSMGRLFDGVASLLDICHHNSFEAEAAMKLESCVTKPLANKALVRINKKNQLDLSLLIKALMECKDKQQASNLFHGTLAYAIAKWVRPHAVQRKLTNIILSGGCFQNKVLLHEVRKYLLEQQLEVFVSQQVPVNDGGISLGQAWLTANKFKKDKQHVFSDSRQDYCA